MTTQPICLPCWGCHYPDQVAWRVRNDAPRTCCRCGTATSAGTYIRIDPASVPYPSEDR